MVNYNGKYETFFLLFNIYICQFIFRCCFDGGKSAGSRRDDFTINTLVQWHTVVSCKTIGSDIEVKKYVRDWRKCKQNILIAYKILLVGFIAIALISVPMCVFLCSGWLALYSLYTMPGANTMQEGLLVTGMQEQIDTINKKLFLNQLLVDSIYDEKNYLTERVEHLLEEKVM